MLTAVILVCLAGAPDCSVDTAQDVLRTPVASANPGICFMQAQAYLAETEIGRTLRAGDVVRIACVRRKG